MSPGAAVAGQGESRRFALVASLACLGAALVVTVLPGWVMSGF